MLNTNTPAKAKLVFVKNKNTYKLVIAFNVTRRHPVTEKLIFPVQKQCAFVSGDISAETLSTDLVRILKTAQETIRSNNITFVD